MPAVRPPGVHNQLERPISNDPGTLYPGSSPAAGPHGKTVSEVEGLTSAQQAILLDVTQFTLDIIGVFEPTPLADTSNAAISVFRGEFLNAGISLLGVVPYAGDIAKAGRLGRRAKSVTEAIELAIKDGRFASYVRPLFQRLWYALDSVPLEHFPKPLHAVLENLKHRIGRLVPGIGRATVLQECVDKLLLARFGNAQWVGSLPQRNVKIVAEYFLQHGFDPKNKAHFSQMLNVLRGADPYKAVEIVHFKKGEVVAQYVDMLKSADREVGEWFVKRQGAVGPANLGISSRGRVRKEFILQSDVIVLKSKSAPVKDSWTKLVSQRPRGGTTAAVVEAGVASRVPAEIALGGGDQYFLPRAWDFLKVAE